MHILFAAPQYVGLEGIYGGVFSEMRNRAYSLKMLGHDVTFMNTWEYIKWDSFDLCHLFMANGDSFKIGEIIQKYIPLVVSPIIDRINNNVFLKAAVNLDGVIPGLFTNSGKCAKLCSIADLVVLRSQDEKHRLERGLGIKDKSYLSLSPVIVPKDKFGLIQPANSRKKVLFLGDMGNKRKNIFRLLQAFKGIDADLILAGKLPIEKEYERLVKFCYSIKNVHLFGPQKETDKWDMLNSCDILVLPSLMEGIGLVAIEAGFLGKTIVITKNGGPVDYFRDHAYYVDPLSVGSIHSSLKYALIKPRNPKNYLIEHLDILKLGNILVSGYNTILKNKRVVS